MDNIWKAFLRNLSNLLSLLSILITLYFGLWYVPDWIDDVQKQKIAHSERAIEQSVKELIYSDTVTTYGEIEPLIKSGELELGQSYPLSAQQLLIEVQTSFMNDRFLPLNKRRELIAEVEILRLHLPKEQKLVNASQKSSSPWAKLSIALSIIFSLASLYGFYARFRRDRDTKEEIDNQILNTDIVIPQTFVGSDYENRLLKVLQNRQGVEIIRTDDAHDLGFDVEFRYEGQSYYIEFKYLTRSKVGLNSLMRFLNSVKGMEGEFWFVHNAELTNMVAQKFKEFQRISGKRRIVKLCKVETESEFSALLDKMLG